MNPQPPEPKFAASSILRRMAALVFLLLLAGYLIFNRTFAHLGFPPFYVGEMALSLALIAALFDFKSVFIEPLKHSLVMRLVALFMFYGLIRVAIDAPARGLDAARDGAICLYAIAAFLAPWLLSTSPIENPAEALLRFLTPVSLLALLYAAAIYFGWISAPADVKVDFLALSAAVAFCIWTSASGFNFVRLKPSAFKWFRPASRLIGMAAVLLLFLLPIRALWLAPFVALGVMLLAAGITKKMILPFCLAAALGIGVLAFVLPKIPAVREKIAALTDPDERHFQTSEGQRAANSVKWRLVFWRRCVTETLDKSPVFGLGFGTNLTDLMRGTADWPMFEDSQNAAKYGSPNRHPHSAHVTVFARLGIVGLILWLAVLVLCFAHGLKNCWRERIEPPADFEKSHVYFWNETALLCLWSIYVLAMTFGVVLENPFGGIWFWTLAGIIATRPSSRISGQARASSDGHYL